MNITKYRVDDSEFQIYYGKASIRDNFYIVNADERFYHLVGKKSGFPIPEFCFLFLWGLLLFLKEDDFLQKLIFLCRQ